MNTNTKYLLPKILTVRKTDAPDGIVLVDENDYGVVDCSYYDTGATGLGEAEIKANEIAKRYNMHTEAMDIILTFVRESKSDTETVKKAMDLLNRNKK